MNTIGINYKTCFYSKEKTVVFSKEDISVYCKNKLLTKISKDDIKEIRYGISAIRGIEFTIGRVYCIDIRKNSHSTIKIRLKSLYGINKKILHQKYEQIIDYLYDYYLYEQIAKYLECIKRGESVEIAGVIFNNEGVNLDLKRQDGFIKWENLSSRAYTYYYTLLSKENPDFYKAFTYIKDWNAIMVYLISRQLLIDKGFYKNPTE